MDQTARNRLQREIENEADRLFPGLVRRVALVQPGEPLVSGKGRGLR
jgi:hypothetical protein